MNIKILGCIGVVAGTAIGAGMLAIPIATAAIGFVPAIILLLITWVINVYTGFLMLDVNLRSGIGDNLHTIAGNTLGKFGQVLVALSFLSLLYSLTAAYIAGGSSLLSLRAENLLAVNLDSSYSVLLFGISLGIFAAFGVVIVDRLCRFLIPVKLLLLIVLVIVFLPLVTMTNLVENDLLSISMVGLIAALPVVSTSFGYHVCIASLVRYLNGNAKDLKIAIVIGSGLPLICYILWLLITQGSLGGNTIATTTDGKLANLINLLQIIAQYKWVSEGIALFADIALITSFLGVSLSLFDYLQEAAKSTMGISNRLAIWLMTFVPPIAFALLYPEGFVIVLGFAAIPLILLATILPVAMMIKQRKADGDSNPAFEKLAITIAAFWSITVVASVFIHEWGFLRHSQ